MENKEALGGTPKISKTHDVKDLIVSTVTKGDRTANLIVFPFFSRIQVKCTSSIENRIPH